MFLPKLAMLLRSASQLRHWHRHAQTTYSVIRKLRHWHRHAQTTYSVIRKLRDARLCLWFVESLCLVWTITTGRGSSAVSLRFTLPAIQPSELKKRDRYRQLQEQLRAVGRRTPRLPTQKEEGTSGGFRKERRNPDWKPWP